INKTIGINKLGTLLSSQTTDTPGTTTTKQTAVDRSGATSQTYPASRPDANPYFRIFIGRKRVPTELRRSHELPEFGLEFGGLAARGNQLFAVSLAAT
ncbi:hypothetical protein, partial [Arthrobacter sp. BE255]|uniref:hypothetical protein n=1 Tax=Arthrobacter sp. BE255 TaxID=2817721 RepID=UPI00286B0DAB